MQSAEALALKKSDFALQEKTFAATKTLGRKVAPNLCVT